MQKQSFNQLVGFVSPADIVGTCHYGSVGFNLDPLLPNYHLQGSIQNVRVSLQSKAIRDDYEVEPRRQERSPKRLEICWA